MSEPGVAERIRNCLLGGAVGDALGAPLEFLDTPEVLRLVEQEGVELVRRHDGRALVTDDTQMTLFTAEGLIRDSVRRVRAGDRRPVESLHGAYARWLTTQGCPWPSTEVAPGQVDGWLVAAEPLAHRRAPGGTCLSALDSGHPGTLARPLNDSKGCGAIMRAAPAGFNGEGIEAAFELGIASGAITHGHPGGYLPAGVLAGAVAGLLEGADLRQALETAGELLASHEGADETHRYLQLGLERSHDGLPSAHQIDDIAPRELPTTGWMGPDALGVAVWCALGSDDAEAALVAAVAHGGDSDSTGAITGNLLGAALGADGVPQQWTNRLDVSEIAERIAADSCIALWHDDPPIGTDDDPAHWDYPPW